MGKIKGTFIVRRPGNGDSWQKKSESKATVSIATKKPGINKGDKKAVS